MTRIRFAPSPTGFLHVGGLRTALYCELFARKNNGRLILRIEDTDRTRLVDGGVENIIRTLEWAGIKPDEGPYVDDKGQLKQRGDYGPYIQSERLDIYKKYIDQLLENGKAYRCYCTPERLEEMRDHQKSEGTQTMYDRRCRNLDYEICKKLEDEGRPFVVRLAMPTEGVTVWDDLIRGHIEISNDQIDDQVLLKSDGFPTYHLAVVVDDHLMGITHVIRGEEWCPSTPKHVVLYEAFGWEQPKFAHLPLLLNRDRSKLSKRQGDVAVEDYRDKGYLSEALVNFVALLGWNPNGDREIYDRQELVDSFDLSKINRGGAVFDLEKLNWMNGEYIKKLSDEELVDLVKPFFEKVGLGTDQEIIAKAALLERSRAKTLSEIPAALLFIFVDPEVDPDLLPWKKSTPEIAKDRLVGLREYILGLDSKIFDSQELIEMELLGFITKMGWTNAETLWPMRVALTGLSVSPGPFEVAWVLGQKVTIQRLESAIVKL
ncbi:glutamate--tRNA ligase [Candidatus Uhrbacteria bacterium RIFOXYC2_FULL_47_19]|uniref:Glutamate--tRNA ligase n=1 Tax=Candidatus Uhrbacteria bacterium RIFOXYC2_FULL_47_19 TaxID=1802424 RepID=A0A1F7WC09_9BACT|nr:MAG: glutamate--tRNA ligase [Candidatus Uhrbacteria bacterium RIFOXYC2_FULL_47_19]HCC21774.1 glutamate--tRNA ligase [Candidatus Uhrbacteria bacterium]